MFQYGKIFLLVITNTHSYLVLKVNEVCGIFCVNIIPWQVILIPHHVAFRKNIPVVWTSAFGNKNGLSNSLSLLVSCFCSWLLLWAVGSWQFVKLVLLREQNHRGTDRPPAHKEPIQGSCPSRKCLLERVEWFSSGIAPWTGWQVKQIPVLAQGREWECKAGRKEWEKGSRDTDKLDLSLSCIFGCPTVAFCGR